MNSHHTSHVSDFVCVDFTCSLYIIVYNTSIKRKLKTIMVFDDSFLWVVHGILMIPKVVTGHQFSRQRNVITFV